ncbi:MAG: ABC transporter permease, partial [Proteobacteria bacterium]|nr:ABC transporter permease [Pseudomonadota bacterium]
MSVITIVIYIVAMLVVAVLLNLGGWWVTIRVLNRLGRRLRFASFVAIRHLRGRKSGFLTAIGVLSILGVSFSSCTLVTVLSVMGGFSEDLKGKILKTNAHIVVDNYGADFDGWSPLMDQLRKIDDVKAVTPLLRADMMMNARTNNHAIMLKGVDLKSFDHVSGVLTGLEQGKREYLTAPEKLFEEVRAKRTRLYGGFADKEPDEKAPDRKAQKATGSPGEDDDKGVVAPPAAPRKRVLPAVIVGRELSKSLRLYIGEEVNIINPIGGIGPTGPIPKSRPFRVGGIFFSGMFEFDNAFVYMSLKAAQKYLNRGNRISEIQVAVVDPDDAPQIAQRIAAALKGSYRVRSWNELNAALFSALKLEKIVMFIFLSLAILVASFCIIATLTMLVLEKGSEVSVLMTLGTSAKEVQSIFRFEGYLIGLVGTVSGLLVGFGLCMFLSTVGLPIDPEIWYIDKLPVDLSMTEFLLVGLASMVITQLATIYPAYAAALLTPVEG